MSNHRVELTSPEMRLKVARIMGYKQVQNEVWSTPPDKHGTTIQGDFRKVVPDFPDSVDACREHFPKHLNVAERKAFFKELLRFCTDKRDADLSNAATLFLGGIEWCESFLRVKKAWEEAPLAETGATVGA